ncbi:PIG-L family deacetylase [soil metagenome]
MVNDVPGAWAGTAPEPGDHVLVVAPHPDDEVIAAAGLLVWLSRIGARTSVLAVTDGEGSHARSKLVTPEELRGRRARERAVGLSLLGVSVAVERLGLPDGEVARREEALVRALLERSDPSTTIVAPWRHDGHVDHDAVGRAASTAAARTGAALWEVPIWAKVRAPGSFAAAGPGRCSRLVLSPELRTRKRSALGCHRSQVEPLGPSPLDGPVVHPHEVLALLDGVEVLRWT